MSGLHLASTLAPLQVLVRCENVPRLPAWTCKLVGGTTVHWGACALRMREYEFKPRTRYGEISGANLLDWPIDLHEMEPYTIALN